MGRKEKVAVILRLVWSGRADGSEPIGEELGIPRNGPAPAVCHYGWPHFIYNNWLETVTRFWLKVGSAPEFMKSAGKGDLDRARRFRGVLVFWRQSRCGYALRPTPSNKGLAILPRRDRSRCLPPRIAGMINERDVAV